MRCLAAVLSLLFVVYEHALGFNVYHSRRTTPTILSLPNRHQKTTTLCAISQHSFIQSITCENLAGVYNNDDGEGVSSVSINMGLTLNAVTGESGSGKSLLVSKLLDIVTGGKATPSMVQKEGEKATLGLSIRLTQPHLDWVQQQFTELGYPSSLLLSDEHGYADLALQRTLERSKRLSSTCIINGVTVPLKTVKQVVAPLVAIVDAPAAATALARPQSRLAVLDTAIDYRLLEDVNESYRDYQANRQNRINLEQELANLPTSVTGNDIDVDLLRHWVEELDVFETKLVTLCETVAPQMTSDALLIQCAKQLSESSFFDMNDGTSNLYVHLMNLRESMRAIDSKLESARHVRDSLASLSLPNSASSALETARNYLYDASSNEPELSQVTGAAEEAHTCLNDVEEALRNSVRSLDDEQKGLIAVLERIKYCVAISEEEIDNYISEWNVLARKHGVAPNALPSCHSALRNELDGNVDARTRLPEAREVERLALDRFNNHCIDLSQQRQEVAASLSTTITTRLPSLGMSGSKFVVDVYRRVTKPEDATTTGFDSVNFLLFHGDSKERGGRMETVASAGEKARIMLAMECDLPGSAGALCRMGATLRLPPVAVVYDEIDAHVGGRAAVSIARMLADQTGQIISITHSPSVAAAAETHLVIQNNAKSDSFKVPVKVSNVIGGERRRELARMAAGDIAPEQAENLADALLQDYAGWRGESGV